MLEQLLQWDRDTFIYLNSLGSDTYDGFWSAITNFSNWTPLFVLLIFLIFRKNSKKEAFLQLLTFSIMLVLLTLTIFLVKEGVGRLRPCNDPEINTLIRVVRTSRDYSFFSGHAATSFSIATLAILFLRKRFRWIYIIYLWPLLFSYSRIYLGVHYPIDIIVGADVGALFALLFYKLSLKFRAPYLK